MVKHMLKDSDEETIQMVTENLYIQYFLGYESFTSKAPFDSSLLLEIRKGMGMEQLNRINEVIYQAAMGNRAADTDKTDDDSDNENYIKHLKELQDVHVNESAEAGTPNNRGRMLVDATACPQDIAYPTDLGLLNASREKCEEIIDKLFTPMLHGAVKSRIYREKARKAYLSIAKKKNKTRAELKTAIGRQLRYVKRDLKTIDILLSSFAKNPLKEKDGAYVETIRRVHEQQTYMRRNKTHSVAEKVVSIHQPHVCPLVRRK